MTEIKNCPVCGQAVTPSHELTDYESVSCVNPDCFLYGISFRLEDWQKPRPVTQNVLGLVDQIEASVSEWDKNVEKLHKALLRRAKNAEVEAMNLKEQLRWHIFDENNPETYPPDAKLYQVLINSKFPSHELFTPMFGWQTDRRVTHWRSIPKLGE